MGNFVAGDHETAALVPQYPATGNTILSQFHPCIFTICLPKIHLEIMLSKFNYHSLFCHLCQLQLHISPLDDVHKSQIYLLCNILKCSVTWSFTTTTSFSALCFQALFSQGITCITNVSYKTLCNYSQRNHHSCYTLNYLLFMKNGQNLTDCQNGHHLSMKQNYFQSVTLIKAQNSTASTCI
jgi:hypothetical protein